MARTAKTRTAPKMSLCEALADPALRAEIDAIEDIWSSLDRGDRSDPTLEGILDFACAQFKARTGIDLDPRH